MAMFRRNAWICSTVCPRILMNKTLDKLNVRHCEQKTNSNQDRPTHLKKKLHQAAISALAASATSPMLCKTWKLYEQRHKNQWESLETDIHFTFNDLPWFTHWTNHLQSSKVCQVSSMDTASGSVTMPIILTTINQRLVRFITKSGLLPFNSNHCSEDSAKCSMQLVQIPSPS